MAFEDAFGIDIPDAVCEGLVTPGDVVRYLERRRAEGQPRCLTQRAFHAVRRACVEVLGCERGAVRPTTSWQALLPEVGRRRTWRSLHRAAATHGWPPMRPWQDAPPGQHTVADTARFVARRGPGDDFGLDAGWTRQRIEATVSAIVCEHCGVTSFDWDDSFVNDFGLD